MPSFQSRTRKPPPPEILQRKDFEGVIRLVTYASEDGGFKVVTFRTGDDVEFKASGNLYGAAVGEPLLIKGEWKEHPKHGWTFQIASYIVQAPKSEEGILAYLGSGLIKGVREETAKKIVAHFGEKTLDVLDETPELLLEVPKLTRATARRIMEQWAGHKSGREVMLFLKQQGLSNAIAMRLIKHYGDNAAAVLRTNPYRAGLDVRHIGFTKADEIAAKMGIARDSAERIQAAFVHVLDQAAGDGHTFLPREELLERAHNLLDLDQERIAAELEHAVTRGYTKRMAVGDRPECYFIPALYACESGCATELIAMLQSSRPLVPSAEVEKRSAEFQSRYRIALAPQQQEAVRMASAGGVCVITGGPGTGKTTLVRALLHVMKGADLRIALCSPTGRAAQRLSETTHEEAMTIHRLLKWNAQTGRFTHDREKPLEVDLLIVDEASMLDVILAYSLLRAIPIGAAVVLVGDVDQLPSVGPGTFLRDLIESGRAKTTRLNVIFRQAEESLIIRNSHRINEGHALVYPNPDQKDADFFFVEREEHEAVRDTLITMLTERIPKRLGCDPIDGVQVLTPMRRGALGTAELNQLIQSRLNPRGELIGAGLAFRRGDKVIQNANNYDLDVYNGDVGRVTSIDNETRQVRVRFGKRVVVYTFEDLDQLELAYAVTIHKSQGSEYPAVIVLMHTSHYIMLKRNLLYTAVTRGKKLVVVIGNRRALFQAIKTSGESDRMTALRQWLVRPPEKEELF